MGEAQALSVQSPEPVLGHPFRWSQRQRSELPVTVQGQLPDWLRGKLLRTCPADLSRGPFQAEHWFDGLGLLYAFEIGQGVHFRQQLLASLALQQADQGRASLASFGTELKRGLFQRLLEPIPRLTDNANVNVIPWQGKWLAMTETPYQHVVQGDTLHSEGLYQYQDELPRGLSMTAHPHYDAKQQALVNVGLTLGKKSELWVFRQHKDSHARVLEGKLALSRVPYVHAFGLSDHYAVIIDHPLSVQPWRMLWSNRGYIQHFAWQPERGTRLLRLDRRTGKWDVFETDPLFCFHVVNMYEQGNELVFDFLAYPDATIIDRLRTAALRGGLPSVDGRYVRARMIPGQKRVELEQLSDVGFEFPQIAYRNRHAQPYRYAWGARLISTAGGWSSELLRVDQRDGSTRSHRDAAFTYGEPVCVPRPGASAEDDGVLLAVGSHADEERTRLLVLDAATLEPLATCEASLSVPMGFHGNFQLSQQTE